MQTLKILVASFFCFSSLNGISQQVADTLYNPVVSSPVYSRGQGSIIMLDDAHANFHTLNGRFKAFATVLKNDGYVLQASSESFTSAQLSRGKILVIANALHPSNGQQWTLPTPSAFTDTEIEVVNDWVKNGGSLFLIADHMPFPGAAEKLAASFGFKFHNGFAMKTGGQDIFSPGKGLTVNVLTKGRNEKETITSLQTFTGQAFEIPKSAQPVVVLNSKYTVKLPQTAWEFKKDTPSISGEGLAQGAYMNYGKGRIVVFGEAAMFTAQLQGKNKIGMNEKSASQNAQFLLNTIHWLDGILE
ncbi:MAG TPA: DUF4350 domain-containing protein [Chryseolinea sp.]|nr:DUF4350 domain-containing protein [Chryseolinea sp.]